MFNNVRIILVNTSHPGNIGAAARAMKNMGLQRLYLVEPKNYPSAEATARASGADDVLAQAIVTDSLEDALADCNLVIGASARLRSVTWPQLNPRQCAGRMLSENKDSQVALVFGREHSGLSNAELDHCHYLVHIPTNPQYTSLNVAAAVQVISYELFIAETESAGQGASDTDNADTVNTEVMESFYKHLRQVVLDVDFVDQNSPKHLDRIMRRLRRLFNQTRPDQNTINILRGVLTAIQDKISANTKG